MEHHYSYLFGPVNKLLIWMNGGTGQAGSDWTVATVDADTVLAPLLRPSDIRPPAPTNPVVIDPGHGGEDTGARAPGRLLEKHLVLDVARRVLPAIVSAGTKAKLTRSGDTTLTLKQRADLARKWNAALFVSIHMNSAPNKAAYGIETYVLPAAGFASTAGRDSSAESAAGNSHNAANTLLAYCIHRQLLNHTKTPDRGIRRARFDVLRDAPCPAVLIECGFLSNAEERKRLEAAQYRATVARGIAEGIRDFLRKTSPPAKDKP